MKFRVFLSVFLCIALSFSLCSVAFAENTAFSITGHWYGSFSDSAGYQSFTTISTGSTSPGSRNGLTDVRLDSISIVFPEAGTVTLAFNPSQKVTNVSNCKSWSLSDDKLICGVTVESSEAGTVNCTVTTSGFQYAASCSISGSFHSSAEPGPDDPANDGTGSMNGWTGLKLLDVENGGTQWVIYNAEIGQLISLVSLGEASYQTDFWIAKMLSHFGYSSWKWKYNEETGKIDFELPEMAQGSWMDMIYRFMTYDYWWNSKLWSGNVAGSWYGNLSGMLTQSLGTLNATVKQIQDVLSNDKDLAIKNATENERQWIQDYFEGNSDYKVDEAKIQDFSDTGDEFSAFLAGGGSSSLSDFWSAINEDGSFYNLFWTTFMYQSLNFGALYPSAKRIAPNYSVPSFIQNQNEVISSALAGDYDGDESIFEPSLFGGGN